MKSNNKPPKCKYCYDKGFYTIAAEGNIIKKPCRRCQSNNEEKKCEACEYRFNCYHMPQCETSAECDAKCPHCQPQNEGKERRPVTATEIIRDHEKARKILLDLVIDNAKKALYPPLKMKPVFGRELERQCANLMEIIREKDETIHQLYEQLKSKYKPYVEIAKRTEDGRYILQMILERQAGKGYIRFII